MANRSPSFFCTQHKARRMWPVSQSYSGSESLVVCWSRQGDSAVCYDWTQSIRTFVSMPPVQRQGARGCSLDRPVSEIVKQLLALSE